LAEESGGVNACAAVDDPAVKLTVMVCGRLAVSVDVIKLKT